MRKGTGRVAITPLIPMKVSLYGANGAPCRGQWRPQENADLKIDIPPGADPDLGRLSPLIVETVCWPCTGLWRFGHSGTVLKFPPFRVQEPCNFQEPDCLGNINKRTKAKSTRWKERNLRAHGIWNMLGMETPLRVACRRNTSTTHTPHRGGVQTKQQNSILDLSLCSQEFHRRDTCPQSLGFSLQSKLGYQLRLLLLSESRREIQAGLLYLSNMVSFRENCEANIRSLGISTALSLYSMYDFWQIPSSLQDSVTPSIERDLGCIWATFSLFFQTSLSVVSKSSVYFSGLLFPPTPLYLLYNGKINCFLLDGVLPLQNGEPVWVSVTDTQGEESSHGCPALGQFSSMAPGLTGLPFLFLSLESVATLPVLPCSPPLLVTVGHIKGKKMTKKDPESLALSEKVELSQCMTLGLQGVPSLLSSINFLNYERELELWPANSEGFVRISWKNRFRGNLWIAA